MSDVTITAGENGPCLVSGQVRLTDHDGREIDQPDPLPMRAVGKQAVLRRLHLTVDFDGTLAN